MKPKEVFDQLHHVDEIWVTEDGKFHLSDQYGGKRHSRDESISTKLKVDNTDDDADDDADAGNEKKKYSMTARDVIELINIANTPEDIDELIQGDDRVGVLKAADAKKAKLVG
jgi:hypothetical protein